MSITPDTISYLWTMFSRLPPPNNAHTQAKTKLSEPVIQDASIEA